MDQFPIEHPTPAYAVKFFDTTWACGFNWP